MSIKFLLNLYDLPNTGPHVKHTHTYRHMHTYISMNSCLCCVQLNTSKHTLEKVTRKLTHTQTHTSPTHTQPLDEGRVFPWVIHWLVCSHVGLSSRDLFPSILAPQTRRCVCVCVCVCVSVCCGSPPEGCQASSFTWYCSQTFNWMCLCQCKNACDVSWWVTAFVKKSTF